MSKYTEGLTITDLLLVLFIGLKITHQIDWSWWWVMSPLRITAIIAAVAGFLAAFSNDE
jgi:hypothetical protein